MDNYILDKDPLIENPIKLIGADYENGLLKLKLSHSVSEKWIKAFKTIGNCTYIQGKHPQNYDFRYDTAIIPTSEYDNNKDIVNLFKQYLIEANKSYRIMIENEILEIKRLEDKKNQEKIHQEEIKKKILGEIEI